MEGTVLERREWMSTSTRFLIHYSLLYGDWESCSVGHYMIEHDTEKLKNNWWQGVSNCREQNRTEIVNMDLTYISINQSPSDSYGGDLSLGIFTPISINYLPSINFWTVWWLRLESSRNETHNLTFALPFAFTSKTWQVKYDCYLYCYYWSYEMFYRLFPLDEYRSRSSLRSLCQDLDRYQRDWTVYLLLIDGHEENLKLLSFQS